MVITISIRAITMSFPVSIWSLLFRYGNHHIDTCYYHVYPCFHMVISVSIWSLLFRYGNHHIETVLLPCQFLWSYVNFCSDMVITVLIWWSPYRNVLLPYLSLFPCGNFCFDMDITISKQGLKMRNEVHIIWITNQHVSCFLLWFLFPLNTNYYPPHDFYYN